MPTTSSRLSRLAEMEARYDGPMPQSARDYIENGNPPTSTETLRSLLKNCIKQARESHRDALRYTDARAVEYHRQQALSAIHFGKQHRAKLRARAADPVVVVTEGDAELWSGAFSDFIAENEFSTEEVTDIRAHLDAEGRALIGGGAAPLFTLAKVA